MIPGGLGAGGAAGGGANPLAGGMDPAMQDELRRRMMENPALLQGAVQALVQNNPQLAQYLNEHPEALYQMLTGDDGGEDDGLEGQAPGGPHVISLTAEEMEAIQRVCSLFFLPFFLINESYTHIFPIPFS